MKRIWLIGGTDELPDSVSSTILKDLGTKDMSDPTTLTNFIKYGIENYSADHYVLILDDHGGGWRGACYDEQNGAGDLMSMPDIKKALSDGEESSLMSSYSMHALCQW